MLGPDRDPSEAPLKFTSELITDLDPRRRHPHDSDPSVFEPEHGGIEVIGIQHALESCPSTRRGRVHQRSNPGRLPAFTGSAEGVSLAGHRADVSGVIAGDDANNRRPHHPTSLAQQFSPDAPTPTLYAATCVRR